MIETPAPAGDGLGAVDRMIGRDAKPVGVSHVIPLRHESAVQVEDLNAGILAVAHIDEVSIDGDRVRKIELPRPGSLHAPTEHEVADPVELQDPRVAVA